MRKKSSWPINPVFLVFISILLLLNYLNDPEGFSQGLPYVVVIVTVVSIIYVKVKKVIYKSHAPFREGLQNGDPETRMETLEKINTYFMKHIDQFGDLTPFIINALGDAHPSVRARAAHIFATYADVLRSGGKGSVYRVFPMNLYPDIAKALYVAMKDDNKEVIRHAEEAINKLQKMGEA